MNRIYAGAPISFTYDVSSSGNTHTAVVIDATGRFIEATTSTSDPNVTVSVAASEWLNGESGHGHLEIADETGAIVKSDRFRIMAGLAERRRMTRRYGDRI